MIPICGIAGFYLRDPDLKVDKDSLLDFMLLCIEHRGRDATGFVAVGDESIEWHKASCDAKTFCQYRRWVPSDARIVLGHTRYATQGLPEFVENNHPLKRGPFYIVHNGHVNNDKELFTKSDRSRYGRVDSEAIAARLSSMEDLSRLNEVMEEIDGHAAVAAVQEGKPDHLVVAKGKSSPLWVYDGRVIVMFASTKEAIVKAHEQHIGHLAVSRLSMLTEGTQMEWIGDEMKKSKFIVKHVPIAASSSSAHWSGYGAGWDEQAWGVPDTCDDCHKPFGNLSKIYSYDGDRKLSMVRCAPCYDKHKKTGGTISSATSTKEKTCEACKLNLEGRTVYYRYSEKFKRVLALCTWCSNATTEANENTKNEKVEEITKDYFSKSAFFEDGKCDACNTPTEWQDGFYRHDTDDDITYMLCEECAELWDDRTEREEANQQTALTLAEIEKSADIIRENGWEIIGGEVVDLADLNVSAADLETSGLLKAEEQAALAAWHADQENYANTNDSIVQRTARRFGFSV